MIYQPNKTLYGNFKMYEVAKSDTAVRLGIDNTPSDVVLDAAYEVAKNILQPVRDEFGIPFSPQSWYRCEALEHAITKRSFSRWHKKHFPMLDVEAAWVKYFKRKSHPKGEAVDFEIMNVSNHTLFNWCKLHLPEFDQLIAEFMKQDDSTAGWIHCSYTGNNRNQVLEIR